MWGTSNLYKYSTIVIAAFDFINIRFDFRLMIRIFPWNQLLTIYLGIWDYLFVYVRKYIVNAIEAIEF